MIHDGRGTPADVVRVNPARAGMIRRVRVRGLGRGRKPRASGDDPRMNTYVVTPVS